jgi:hypothetical protein
VAAVIERRIARFDPLCERVSFAQLCVSVLEHELCIDVPDVATREERQKVRLKSPLQIGFAVLAELQALIGEPLIGEVVEQHLRAGWCRRCGSWINPLAECDEGLLALQLGPRGFFVHPLPAVAEHDRTPVVLPDGQLRVEAD